MNCALWLNKQKVQTASKIPENLDVASLRGYFLAGSLIEWLRENGGEDYAEKLSKVSADDPELNQKIAKIFGGRPLRSKPMRTASDKPSEQAPAQMPNSPCSAVSSYSIPSSQTWGSVRYGSGQLGSLGSLGSFGSFSYSQLSSFGEFWEFLQSLGTGSFGSFGLGSYSQWEWLFSLFGRSYGSFYLGSFASFHEWEWEWLFRMFTSGGGGSFSTSSFGSFYMRLWSGLFGSFSYFGSFSGSAAFNAFAEALKLPIPDEYDRIMLETLMRCPLDRFGYGVHNI